MARASDLALLLALEALDVRVERIGDCRPPRSVLAATRDGYAAGMAV